MMSTNIIERAGSRDGLLRLAMRADAVISGLFGIAGLTGWMIEFAGTTRAFQYSMAAFFISYGAIVLALAALPSVRRTGIGVVVANLAYTVAAVVLVVADVVPLTPSGVVFTSTSGIYTLVFAALQYLGWRRIKRQGHLSWSCNAPAPRSRSQL
jgi:hypothetical protein